jgi:hypothetical protein
VSDTHPIDWPRRSGSQISGREWLLAATAILVVSALLSFRSVYEPDLWWHLAQGREDAAGRLVRTNVFSFNYPEYRQHYTSWLFDTAAFLAWSMSRDIGVQLLQAAVLAVTLAVLYSACRRLADPAACASVMVLGVFVLEPRAIPRPHLVSFLGIALCVWAIGRATASRSWTPLGWSIPIVALWSNFHVECVFGAGVLGCFVAGELARPSSLARRDAARAALVVAACGAALLANPYGIGILRYLYENASVPQIVNIAELRPPYLPNYRAFYFYAVIAAALMASQPKRLRAWELLALVVLALAGFRFLRLTPLLFLVSAPILAERLGAWIPRPLDRRAVIVTSLLAGMMVSRLPLRAYVEEWRPGRGALSAPGVFSPGAAAFIRTTGLAGPVFNSFNIGGFLAWSLYPSVRTFQDTRLQAYPPRHLPSIMEASASQQAWDTLMRPVDWAVLSRPSPNQLSGAGRFPRDAWATVFWDDATEIVVRRSSAYRQLVADREYRWLTPDADPLRVAERLSSTEAGEVREEVRRHLTEQPDSVAASIVACADGQITACALLEHLAASRPFLRDVLERARRIQR